jgi:hypothetical protein
MAMQGYGKLSRDLLQEPVTSIKRLTVRASLQLSKIHNKSQRLAFKESRQEPASGFQRFTIRASLQSSKIQGKSQPPAFKDSR